MAYDPFAPVPDPSAIPTDFMTTAVPTALASNNALATVAPNGNTGVVPPQMRGHMPFDMNAFMQAIQTWRDARPDRPMFDHGTGRPDDWRTQMDTFHTAMRDWAQSHPSPMDYRPGASPVAAPPTPAPIGSVPPMPPVPAPIVPGAGLPPAPPGFANPGNVGMVPGVPGSVGLNPGAPNPGGSPKFSNDWRSLVPAIPPGMPTRGFRPGG